MAKSEYRFQELKADTVPKYLRLGAQQWRDQIYMRQKDLGIWRSYTWQEVYREVEALALGLKKLGLERCKTVAIIGENSPELFWAHFAVLSVGAKVVHLYPDMTPAEVKYILDHSKSAYLIAEDQEQVDKYFEIREELPAIKKVIFWDSKGMWQYKDLILAKYKDVQGLGRADAKENPGHFDSCIDQCSGDDIAVLCYTSGTTGLPKGVVLTQSYLLDSAFRMQMANNFKPFSNYLSYLSPAWATEQFLCSLSLLAPLILNFPEKPETVLHNIREIGVHVLMFGPRQWESLLSDVQLKINDGGYLRRKLYDLALKIGGKNISHGQGQNRPHLIWRLLHYFADWIMLRPIRDNLGLNGIDFAMTGGSATSPDVFNLYHAMGVKLCNVYGSTEMGIYTQHEADNFNPETLGKWYKSHPGFGPPLEWRIDDNKELLVRGGCGFLGYYKNEKATAESQKDGWFLTGDAVKMLDNGELVFLDRVKDLKELATGYLFPPQFIETRLRFSPYIKEAMVLGDENKPFVSALVNIDSENVGQWAEKHGIPYTTFPDLSQNTQVCDLIQNEIARINQMLDPESRIKRFVNLPKELDPDEAELTRTRKLRRGLLEERYGKLIAAIYASETHFETEVTVKYRDGRTGVVKNQTRINSI